MNRLFAGLLVWLPLSAHAAINVFACEPEWGALTRELGGDAVKVFAATSAMQDPHGIEARPSLIAQMRRADLVGCSGADLEAAWLPVLLRESGNAAVQPGRPGYFEAARQVPMLDRPATIDRSQGDVHASGNPPLARGISVQPCLIGVGGQSLSVLPRDIISSTTSGMPRMTRNGSPLN